MGKAGRRERSRSWDRERQPHRSGESLEEKAGSSMMMSLRHAEVKGQWTSRKNAQHGELEVGYVPRLEKRSRLGAEIGSHLLRGLV